MNFEQITKSLKEISTISSINEKQIWLKNHDDPDFKNLLKWYFDNSYPTGIGERKFDKIQCPLSNCNNKLSFQDAIDYLKINNTGTDMDVRYLRMIEMYICNTDEQKETFKKLVCKSYAMGINTPTINKVFPGLIPTFDVALCNKLQDNPDYIIGKEIEITPKVDGNRCIAFKENNQVRLISRQGKTWEGCVEIEQAIKDLPMDNIVLDGELTIKNFLNYPSDQVYKLTSKIVSTKDPVKAGVSLNVFDILPLNEWNTESTMPQKVRRVMLDNLLSQNQSDALVNLAPMYIGTDHTMVAKLMKEWVEPNNQEGLVVKLTNAPYEHKRTKSWLKVKQMETYDLTITGFFEGRGNFTGTLGGFDVAIDLPDGKHVTASVGSGFSLEERETIWKNPESYIGKNIEVQGFELTQNQSSTDWSIRFPVFKGFIPEGKVLNGDYKC